MPEPPPIPVERYDFEYRSNALVHAGGAWMKSADVLPLLKELHERRMTAPCSYTDVHMALVIAEWAKAAKYCHTTQGYVFVVGAPEVHAIRIPNVREALIALLENRPCPRP